MKNRMLLSVVTVLLVVGVGISFAYFISEVLFSGDGSDITLEPGDFIRVIYDAGDTPLSLANVIPGDVASKDFTVTVIPTDTEKEATYAIYFDITNNTFVKCDDSNYDDLTNACERDVEEVIYRLKDNTNQVVAEGTLIGETGRIELLKETKTVDVETVFNYSLEIEFVETNADQNHNTNKVLNGEIVVEFASDNAIEIILADKTIDTSRNGEITGVLTEDTTGTVYSVEDDYGTSYVYAGAPTDNWVYFAGFYWRIIRINGDGSIRMIYNGTTTDQTGEGTQIGTSTYNSSSDDNAYVGYMYGSRGASSYSATHANTNNSTIKGVVDTWYQNSILNKQDSSGQSYDSYVSKEQGFCNDRRVATSSETWWSSDTKRGYGTNTTAYAPFSRFLTTSGGWNTSSQTPTLKCSQSNDYFTVSGSSKGNHELTYPVGLITADEVVLAGGFGGTANQSYYLYTNQYYWTMSASYFLATSIRAYVF